MKILQFPQVNSCHLLFDLAELTSTPYKENRLANRPIHHRVALPMYKHKNVSVNVSNVPNNTRHSATVRLNQKFPLRPANALTVHI